MRSLRRDLRRCWQQCIRLKLQDESEIPANGERLALCPPKGAVLSEPIAKLEFDTGPFVRDSDGREEVAAKLEELHHPLGFFRLGSGRSLDPLHFSFGLGDVLLGELALGVPGAGDARHAGRSPFHADQVREDGLGFLHFLVAIDEVLRARIEVRLGHREVVGAASQFRIEEGSLQRLLEDRLGVLVELRLDLADGTFQLIGRGLEQRSSLGGFFLLLLLGFLDRLLVAAIFGEGRHVHAASLAELGLRIE